MKIGDIDELLDIYYSILEQVHRVYAHFTQEATVTVPNMPDVPSQPIAYLCYENHIHVPSSLTHLTDIQLKGLIVRDYVNDIKNPETKSPNQLEGFMLEHHIPQSTLIQYAVNWGAFISMRKLPMDRWDFIYFFFILF